MYRIERFANSIVVICAWIATAAVASDFDCVIHPRQVLEIRSPLEGLLERVTVDRGDKVRKGQELAFIDTSVERVLLESAKFRSNLEGASRAGQSKLELSTRRLERVQDLSSKDFVSRQTQDEAKSEKELAEAELQEARENRSLAEIEYRRQLTLIRLKAIRSPINGVVMERVLNVGELAEAGVGRKPILRLAEIETLYVEALLPAETYRQIKIGGVGTVSAQLAGIGDQRATVTVVDRVLDAGSGTFGVRLELPNKDGQLPAGVRCTVSFAGVQVGGSTRSGDQARDDATTRPIAPRAVPRPAISK